MSESYAFNPTLDMSPATAGMEADAMFTDTVTVPCGAAPITFGVVVARVTATGISARPIGANPLVGIARRDATIPSGTYAQFAAMSVMTRGRIWALASGTCTKDAVAKFDAATGVFADAGAVTYPQAKFLTGAIDTPANGGTAEKIVLVELHAPTVAA